MSWYDAWRDFLKKGRPAPDTQTTADRERSLTTWHVQCRPPLVLPPPQSAAALPRNLEWLMADRGLTPVQLADKAHISASNIRHLLRGTGYERGTPEASPNPTLTTLLAVAQALGVGIGDLVEERES